MAAELKKDSVVILRMDGEELEEFVNSSSFEAELIDIFSQKKLANASLRECIMTALEQLTVDHGMPPSSDAWVHHNFVKPAMSSIPVHELEQPASQEVFLLEFKKAVESIMHCLKEHPVIVAHTENTIDGSGIKSLLSDESEFDKLLEKAWKDVDKDHNRVKAELLHDVLDVISSSFGLPPDVVTDQVNDIINKSLEIVDADHDEKAIGEEMFKKMVREILENIMLQLEGNPITVSSNSVVHEHFASLSSPLNPPSSLSPQSQVEQSQS